MDIVVKLPDKDYQVMLTKVMLACYGCEIIELPEGAEILTKEAYSDLCMRASKAESE